MAKPGNDDIFPEKRTWGTLEELLLACAVHRHGTESWNSVSAEILKRSSNLRLLTASACRHKYLDLKQRFNRELALPESVAEISTFPWLEELRRLRVDELRRELEQFDLSISSLQSKVKRLEEEREIGLTELETETENSDLDKIMAKKDRSDSGEPVPKPHIQSVNESVFPDPKVTGSENAKRDQRMARGTNGSGGGEDSGRGSCESVKKESDRVELRRGTELVESMAESEGGASLGEEEWKETSDVQSSASLLRKVTSEQKHPDNEDQSPSAKDFLVQSQPSVSLVEILLSQPCGSHFSRRLESQETPEYGKIVRQHLDLEIIRKRVVDDWYKSSRIKFFRDMLLLINNAKVFYQKGSSEFISAEQLHLLVKKQMTVTLNRPREISPPIEDSLDLKSLNDVVALSSKPGSSKPRMSVPIVACRKRSSLAAKPLLLLPPGPEKKSKKTDHVVDDEKSVSDKDETSENDDESLILKKKVTRERTSSIKNVATRNVKNRDSCLNVDDSKGKVKKTDEENKGNKSNTNWSSKKKSAASFLKRMKVGSSSDTVVETLKPSSATDSSTTGKGGVEQRKNNSSNKGNAKKLTTGKNQTNEKANSAKKKKMVEP